MSELANLATSLALVGIGGVAGFLFAIRFAIEKASEAFEQMLQIAIANGDATEEEVRTIISSWRKNL